PLSTTTLFPYTTLFRSPLLHPGELCRHRSGYGTPIPHLRGWVAILLPDPPAQDRQVQDRRPRSPGSIRLPLLGPRRRCDQRAPRSEEHTSELQSLAYLV